MDKGNKKFKALTKIDIESKVWFWLGMILLLGINIRGLANMKVPTIIYDEIGYWSDAAYFLGYDWSGITSTFSYYSYGVGLLLSLIMRISDDMVIVYRLTMGLNVILMLLMYIMAYHISSFINGNVAKLIRTLICVVSLSYPTYMMNIGIAWSEYYMLFMVFLVIYLFVSILKKKNIIRVILFTVSLWYLYSIHQRNVGIVFVGIAAIIYLYFEKKLPLKYVFTVFGISILAFVMHSFIKDSVQSALWLKSLEGEKTIGSSANDYSGRLSSFIFSFKNAGILALIEATIGKIFYLVVSTCGIYILSILGFWRALKERFFLKSKENEKQNETIIFIHLLMATLVLITGMTTMRDGVTQINRSDVLIYGRYMESLIGPLIMLGTMEVYEKKIHAKIYFTIIGIVVVLSSVLSRIYIYGNYNDTFLGSCIGGVFKYYMDAGLFDFVYEAALITILMIVLLFVMKTCVKSKEALFFYLSAVLCIFVINGNCLNKNCRDKIQQQNQVMIPLADYIKSSNQTVPVYCIRGDMPYAHMYLGVLQYLLPNYECSYIANDTEIDGSDYYICVEDFNSIDINDYCQIFASDMGWHVMVRKDSCLYQYYQQ